MRPYQLHVLVEEDPDGGWTARVLELGPLAFGETPEEAIRLIPGLVELLVSDIRQRGSSDGCLHPASAEEWGRFFRASPWPERLRLPSPQQVPGYAWVFEEFELGRLSLPAAA